MEEYVSFYSGQRKLYGTLHRARGPGAVLLVHGFGSFRDEVTGFAELAERLGANGITSLRIDMSGCGESERRGTIKPRAEWVSDVHNGISFLESLGDPWAAKVSLVGMSVGGGAVVVAAALDKRVHATVALAPVADGAWWLHHLWLQYHGEAGWQRFLERVSKDRETSVETGQSEEVARRDIVAHDSTAADTHPQFASKMTLSSADDLLTFRPRLYVSELRCPLLIVHSVDDESVPIAHADELYAHATCERQVHRITGSPHNFWVGPRKEEVLGLTTKWLTQYMGNSTVLT